MKKLTAAALVAAGIAVLVAVQIAGATGAGPQGTGRASSRTASST